MAFSGSWAWSGNFLARKALLVSHSDPSFLGPLLTSDSPLWFTTLGLHVQRSEFEGTPVWTLQSPWSNSGKTVVAIHGGGYVNRPTIFHWLDYAAMARDTGATVVVPIYPLAPQGTAATVVPQTADLISYEIDQHGAENVSVYGDSAGGGLALAAVQELVRRGDPVPSHMVLISPWLDASMSDPASQTIDDPNLNYSETKGWGLLWAGDLDPADPRVSPLFGSLEGLPPTAVYSGSVCSLPTRFACASGPWRKAPTSRLYSGKVNPTFGQPPSHFLCRRRSPFAQIFINSYRAAPQPDEACLWLRGLRGSGQRGETVTGAPVYEPPMRLVGRNRPPVRSEPIMTVARSVAGPVRARGRAGGLYRPDVLQRLRAGPAIPRGWWGMCIGS